MTNQDKIELIEEAQEMLRQAVYNIQSALRDTDHSIYYENYLVRNLRNMIDGGDNPYDANLESMIEVLAKDEESTCEYSGLPSTSTYE